MTTTVNATMKVPTLTAMCKRMRTNRSVMLRGNHGIGKSAIVATLARFFKLRLLDFRLGQRTPGDIIGLPFQDGIVTKFLPPEELKLACTEACLVFFDEMNRAPDEVIQAVFQICLDRRLPDGTPLHKDTRVYAAINIAATYSVNRLDPALLDRFAIADLDADPQDWLAWARRAKDHSEGGGAVDPVVCDFIAAHGDMLFPAPKCEPESVQPSPRSWAALNDDLVHADVIDKPADPIFYAMCVSTLGVEVATAFVAFAKSVDNRVSALDVLDRFSSDPTGKVHEYRLKFGTQKGVDDERIEKWPIGAVMDKVMRMPRERQLGVLEEVAKFVRAMKAPGTKEQAENFRRFVGILDPEVRVSVWSALTSEGIENEEVVRWWHPAIAENIVTGTFGVPVGEKGVGVAPKIPKVFQDKAA